MGSGAGLDVRILHPQPGSPEFCCVTWDKNLTSFCASVYPDFLMETLIFTISPSDLSRASLDTPTEETS